MELQSLITGYVLACFVLGSVYLTTVPSKDSTISISLIFFLIDSLNS